MVRGSDAVDSSSSGDFIHSWYRFMSALESMSAQIAHLHVRAWSDQNVSTSIDRPVRHQNDLVTAYDRVLIHPHDCVGMLQGVVSM